MDEEVECRIYRPIIVNGDRERTSRLMKNLNGNVVLFQTTSFPRNFQRGRIVYDEKEPDKVYFEFSNSGKKVRRQIYLGDLCGLMIEDRIFDEVSGRFLL